jgi:hypothetical protein
MEFAMQKFLCLFIVIFFLGACSTAPEATPNPAQMGMTMFADQVNAQATQAKLESIFQVTAQVVGATATQQAIFVQVTGTQQARLDTAATAEQERRDAQATQMRLDAEATQAQARLDADATAVQARLDVQSTQQAGGTATAFTITQTAIPPANTLTQIANEQNILLRNNEVQMSNLAVDQQREKNTPEWVVPFLIAIVLTAAVALYVYRYSRVREVTDGDGTVQLLFFDDKAIRPQLMAGPVIEFDKDGITMPMLTAPAEQSKVTERAQAVEAIKNMPANTTPQAAQTFNKYFGSGRAEDLPFEILDGDQLPPQDLLDAESVKALEKDWKEAKRG